MVVFAFVTNDTKLVSDSCDGQTKQEITSMSKWLCMHAITLIAGPLTIKLCCLTGGVKLRLLEYLSNDS
jgi:hypothetical protein